jgi:hypothetical protein
VPKASTHDEACLHFFFVCKTVLIVSLSEEMPHRLSGVRMRLLLIDLLEGCVCSGIRNAVKGEDAGNMNQHFGLSLPWTFLVVRHHP